MIIGKLKNRFNKDDIQIVDGNKVVSLYEDVNGITISCNYVDFHDIRNFKFEINNENTILYNAFNNLYNVLNEEIIISSDYYAKCPNAFKIKKNEDCIILYFYKITDNNYYKPSGSIQLNVSEFYEFHELFNSLQSIESSKTKSLKK